jgi:hypothetical protein
METVRVDWPFLARDLAKRLGAIEDLGRIQHILQDAEKDAASLGAPDGWWQSVAREYRTGTASNWTEHQSQVEEMIVAKIPR